MWEVILACGLSVLVGWLFGVFWGQRITRNEAASYRMGEYYLDSDHRKQFRWRDELHSDVRSEESKKLADYNGPTKGGTDDARVHVGDNTPSESSSTT